MSQPSASNDKPLSDASPAAAEGESAPAPGQELQAGRRGEAVEMSPLSDELRELLEKADGQAMTLGRILDELQGRGHMMFIIVIIGPFLFLPTTFGLSAPIGLAIAIIGLCMLVHVRPWLPGFILRKNFPYEGLSKVVGRAAKLADRVQKLARPRLGVMFWPGLINLTGVELTIWALLMALPGPNFLFAFMITLIAFGLLMRDGVFLLLAHVLTFITPVMVWIYWTPIWAFIQEYAGKAGDYWQKFMSVLALAS